MKRKEIILFTIIFIVTSLYGVYLTFATFSNQSWTDISAQIVHERLGGETQQTPSNRQCFDEVKIDLSATDDPNLLQLREYQDKICSSFVAGRMMTFTTMPFDLTSSSKDALSMSKKLKDFAQYGVTPVIIAEPTSEQGLISFRKFSQGTYDRFIDNYFKEIKSSGITDEQMGIWVPFPEANLPLWNNDSAMPEDFGNNVNRYLTALKKYFPQAKTSILLGSMSYDPEDINFENGDYISWVPYIKNINRSLLDSVGIQGFPWISPNNTRRRENINPDEYLSTRILLEGARYLRKREVWFNTGTFSQKYTNDQNKLAILSVTKRKAILNNTLQVLKEAQDQGYRVWINVFAEDKSKLNEATNWSYLDNEESRIIFREFIPKLKEQDVTLSIFDTRR